MLLACPSFNAAFVTLLINPSLSSSCMLKSPIFRWLHVLSCVYIAPMEFTKLSPVHGGYVADASESEASHSLKRKWSSAGADRVDATTVDLQLKQPLPSDWEQCLDLQSGRMYYVNRETSRKSWNRPGDYVHEQPGLALELKMMSTECTSSSSERNELSSDSNMVALACSNCHLLVMLSTSSPSCPNCKYVHSLKSKTPLGGRSF